LKHHHVILFRKGKICNASIWDHESEFKENRTPFIFLTPQDVISLISLKNKLCSDAVSTMNVIIILVLDEGRAIAQVVSRRLPMATVRVRFQVRSFL
jgi:hypothetical protein